MIKKLRNIQKMRIIFLFIFSFISLSSSAQKFYLLIGTYTSTGSKGIYVYEFDVSTGKTKWISNTDTITNPSFLAVSKNGKYVFAVNETNGANPGRISAFSFDKNQGKLNFINSQFSGGDDPCHVAVSADDNWVAVANYSGGSAALFSVNQNGAIKPYVQLEQNSGSSINKERQKNTHVHETVFSPDNGYLFTPDLGTDKIMIYKFNPLKKLPLQPSEPAFINTIPGSGPRHLTFHPDKKFAYLICELNAAVVAYNYDKGYLEEIQTISSLPEDFKGRVDGAEICTSPDGKFLYTSNRGDQNSVTIFSIDPHTGKLNLSGYQSTSGKAPRNFLIDPTGNFLLAANQDSDNIVIFKRDNHTGLLKETGEQIHIPKPVCLQMVPVK